jgi:hypothetical protein
LPREASIVASERRNLFLKNLSGSSGQFRVLHMRIPPAFGASNSVGGRLPSGPTQTIQLELPAISKKLSFGSISSLTRLKW